MTRAEAAARLPVLLAELAEVRDLLATGHTRRKLTTADAREIRRRVANGASVHGTARIYGLNAATVRSLIAGMTYKEPEAQP